MDEIELKEIIKECKNRMKPDGLKTQDQQLPQLSWILLLRCIDGFEQKRKALERDFQESIPKPYRWKDWAGTGDKAITGNTLLEFVNSKLFPALSELRPEKGRESRIVISSAFTDFKNRILNGYALRQIINDVDKIKVEKPSELKIFAKVYQEEIRDWTNEAEKKAYFFTPRALANFIVSIVKPNFKKKEKVFDPACGLGGFLIESLNYMKKDEKAKSDIKKLRFDSLQGNEKSAETYLCGVLNMMLQDIDTPNILNKNSLETPTQDIPPEGEFEVIMSNPTYNEAESKNVKLNLPYELQTTDSALHFWFRIMEMLKQEGRAAMILPNGPLFGTGKAAKIKQRLLEGFNLHTIVRLPESIFAPRTGIQTNILFFDRAGKTKDIWYYQMKVAERLRDPAKPKVEPSYSKTKLLEIQDFDEISEWFKDKKENDLAWKVSVDEIKEYNLDIKNPNDVEPTIDLSPHELIKQIIDDEKKTLSLLVDVEKLIHKEIPK